MGEAGRDRGTRAADYADCKGQGKAWDTGWGVIAANAQNQDIYQACVVGRGWRLSDEAGSPDREVLPNYGHQEAFGLRLKSY